MVESSQISQAQNNQKKPPIIQTWERIKSTTQDFIKQTKTAATDRFAKTIATKGVWSIERNQILENSKGVKEKIKEFSKEDDGLKEFNNALAAIRNNETELLKTMYEIVKAENKQYATYSDFEGITSRQFEIDSSEVFASKIVDKHPEFKDRPELLAAIILVSRAEKNSQYALPSLPKNRDEAPWG